MPRHDDQRVTAAHTRGVTVRVERLFHYPVKGLAGVELDEAHLAVGGGFPYDRAVAVTNGTAPVAQRGWTSPAALYGLARNPGLTRLGVQVGDGPGTPLTVTALGDPAFVVHLDGAGDRAAELARASERVRGLVAPGAWGPPEVVMPRTPLWQRPDGAISIVNLATLRQLGAAWGTRLDLRRFRANLYVDGLAPWEELELVGDRLQVGDVELEVTGPLRRGAGAGVDPDDGSTRVDVSAMLASGVGHRFLGVLARVVGEGRVRRGDAVVRTRVTRSSARHGPAVKPRPGWPRRVEVVGVDRENRTVLSLWLRDPLGLAADVCPGQHVRLHAVAPTGPVWRKYTVSGTEADLVRISIALEPGGRMSEYLRATPREDLRILLSGPFGDVTADPEEEAPLLLLSAGIGITPTLALLREIVVRSPSRPVGVLHVDRGADPAMWGELTTLLGRLPGSSGRVSLHLTAADRHRCRQLGASVGRPAATDVARLVRTMPAPGLEALVCGPDRFRADVRAALREAGLAESAIHLEAFFSPPPEREQVPPAADGPFDVHFSASGRHAVWKPELGTLMDLAESCGLRPAVDCREAACNVCAARVTAGSTMYTTPPMGPPAGEVLICCAVPTTDVTVEL